LIVRKRTGFGKEDFAYRHLVIRREKFIYEQFWFYPMLLLLFGFIVWAYSKMKTRSLNQKRKLLQAKVKEQTAELSKAGEIKDLLISIISHDMVSPLRHVATIAKVLKGGHEKNAQKVDEALSDIQTTSERILSGSNAIINWMKYNNKKIPIDKEDIHLHNLVNEIIGMYLPIAKSKNVILSNEIPASTFVKVDFNVLSIILTNLISNAVKYTDKGMVRICTKKVSRNSDVVLIIQDTGRGMSEKKLQDIREVLKGNVLALKSVASASGLGYVMISELLKIHDLQASLRSEVGKGTTVFIPISS
jgi:signal transduction histidine kinase